MLTSRSFEGGYYLAWRVSGVQGEALCIAIMPLITLGFVNGGIGHQYRYTATIRSIIVIISGLEHEDSSIDWIGFFQIGDRVICST